MPDRFEEILRIAGRPVGSQQLTYVIAEAGANHNRDLGVAKELIDVASAAGADAVKFQTYTGKDLYSSRTPSFEYLGGNQNPQELLDSIALPREWQGELSIHAAERGIHFLSSPFDRAAVDSLVEVGVPALKIASFEIVDLGLIEYAAQTGLPLIISCGMATYGEIEDALSSVERAGNRQVALLRCASVYPADPSVMNIRAIETMRRAFGVPVGLSDHTLGVVVAPAAVALGAALVEKHFTLSREMKGPDHPFALEPQELAVLVKGIRDVEAALGNGRLQGPSEPEAGEMYQLGRRSVVASMDIPCGTTIEADMLTVKRPGYGISPKHLPLIVGRVARVDIPFDEVLTWEMV
jgi:N,N'-diacetyllegionaminate synthase